MAMRTAIYRYQQGIDIKTDFEAVYTAMHSPERAERALVGMRTEENLVELDGIEPTTSCLQSRRSPN